MNEGQLIQQLIPHCLTSGPFVFNTKGSILTQSKEKIEAKSTDHMITRVGVRFCLPIIPLRNGYRWTRTQKEKKSFPSNAPQDCPPLFMASVNPATIPTRLMIMIVVGGISRAVHLKVYRSWNSPLSGTFDMTLKFISTLDTAFRKFLTIAKRCVETLPITQNCSFLHHSSRVTPLHLNSRMLDEKIDMNSAMKIRLAKERENDHYRWCDEFVCEQADGRKETIYYKGY